MITSAWNTKRRMVPRWRSLAATLRSSELGSAKANPSETVDVSSELKRRLERWRLDPTILTGAELVETSIVERHETEAINAARAILNRFDSAAPLVKRNAAQILARTHHADEIPSSLKLNAEIGSLRYWRERTRLYPLDALSWVELALHYVISKELEKARRCIIVALQLAPENRHVLRSAARLFLHLNDPEHAHDLLAKNAATKHDPWLVSAEIAIAELADNNPRFFKQGNAMVDDRSFLPFQTTELAGSIGTAELVGGNRRKARKMFDRSMIHPNANALAQAEWATPNFGSEIVPVGRFKFVRDAHEAKALHRYRQAKFSDVLELCSLWANEEPYSIRPFEFGAATANQIDEHEKSLAFSLEGLCVRPGALHLKNSSAFALGSLGKIEEAEAMLKSMPSSGMPEKDKLISEANWGLIAFRKGDHAQAKARYVAAIDGFEKLSSESLKMSARAYYAREALFAGADDAQKLLSEIRDDLKNRNNVGLLQMLERAEKASKALKKVA